MPTLRELETGFRRAEAAGDAEAARAIAQEIVRVASLPDPTPTPAQSDPSFFGTLGSQLAAGVTVDVPHMAGQSLKYLSQPGGALYEAGEGLVRGAEARQAATPSFAPVPEDASFGQRFASGARMIPPSLAAGLAAIPVARALPQAMPALAKGALGSAVGTAPFGLSQAQQTYENVIAGGGTPEQASAAAWRAGGIESAGETVGTLALGRLFGAFGPAAKSVPEFLRRGAGNMATQVGTEMGQAAGQTAVEQAYTPRYDGLTPTEAAVSTIVPTIGMATMLGGLAAPAQVIQARKAKAEQAAKPPTPTEEQEDERDVSPEQLLAEQLPGAARAAGQAEGPQVRQVVQGAGVDRGAQAGVPGTAGEVAAAAREEGQVPEAVATAGLESADLAAPAPIQFGIEEIDTLQAQFDEALAKGDIRRAEAVGRELDMALSMLPESRARRPVPQPAPAEAVPTAGIKAVPTKRQPGPEFAPPAPQTTGIEVAEAEPEITVPPVRPEIPTPQLALPPPDRTATGAITPPAREGQIPTAGATIWGRPGPQAGGQRVPFKSGADARAYRQEMKGQAVYDVVNRNGRWGLQPRAQETPTVPPLVEAVTQPERGAAPPAQPVEGEILEGAGRFPTRFAAVAAARSIPQAKVTRRDDGLWEVLRPAERATPALEARPRTAEGAIVQPQAAQTVTPPAAPAQPETADALPVQESAPSLPREERPEVGLPQVGARDAEVQVPARAEERPAPIELRGEPEQRKPRRKGKALTKIKVTRQAVDDETGKRMKVKERADHALADVDQQIEQMRSLVQCLAS